MKFMIFFTSVDELELFNDAFERWDNKQLHKLPYYIKICFLALFNVINEMANVILNEQVYEFLPYMKKSWANFTKAMLVKAKW
ncbi:hypothetical protein GIB67_039876 [Kingdonia uniflora]|uniref:Terpene synthase metal-binding domain-containing protein n=1 Tax=Kingdonia uniflora TaxID=39325 RepID=A0A7J7P3B7_9MAGN|nr:hypothetical protein GIB67_039876 [Kingdonia uniflora]